MKGVNFNNANETRRYEDESWFSSEDKQEEDGDCYIENENQSECSIAKETLLQGSRGGIITSDDYVIRWETQDSDYLRVELFNRMPNYETSDEPFIPKATKYKMVNDVKQFSQTVNNTNKEVLPPIESKNNDMLDSRCHTSNIEEDLNRNIILPGPYDSLGVSPYSRREKISKLRNILARTPAEEYFKRLKRQIDRRNACSLHRKTCNFDSKHLQQSVKMLSRYRETVYGAKLHTAVKLPKITTASVRTPRNSRGEVTENRTDHIRTGFRRKMGAWFCMNCDRSNCKCHRLFPHKRSVPLFRHQRSKTKDNGRNFLHEQRFGEKEDK